MEFLNTVSSFSRLIRLPNLLMIAFLQVMAASFLHFQSLSLIPVEFYDPQKLVLIIFSTVLIAAAGNILNDIRDVEIDKINKPLKVVIGRFISPRNALILYGVICFTGLMLSGFVHFYFFVISLVAAQLLWHYSVVLKCNGILGNLVIAALMALSVYVVIYSGDYINEDLVLYYAEFSFLTGLIREIIKDLEDKTGDLACDCNTFAATNSLKIVKRIIFLLLAICVLLLVMYSVAFILADYLIYLSLYQLIILVPLLLYFGNLVYSSTEIKQFSRLSLYIKLIMLAGILSMPLAKIHML